MSYALALHTTTPNLELAISNFDHDARCQIWELGRGMSTHLHCHLQEFLSPQTWQDLSFLAVAKGPGGFTGTRLGMVTARTLAQQLELPLFAISTLAAIAWSYRHIASSATLTKTIPARNTHDETPVHERDIAVQMNAQQGELFVAIYRATSSGLSTLISDRVITPEAWQQMLKEWSHSYQLVHAEDHLASSVTEILDLAYQDWQLGLRPNWSAALPFYGQLSVA